MSDKFNQGKNINMLNNMKNQALNMNGNSSNGTSIPNIKQNHYNNISSSKNRKTKSESNESDDKAQTDENKNQTIGADENNDLENDSLEEDNGLDKVKSKLKILLTIKTFMFVGAVASFFFFIFFIIVFALQYFAGGILRVFSNSGNINNGFTFVKEYVTESSSNARNNEVAFYVELDKVKDKYREDFNVDIDIDYIVGVLMFDNNPIKYFDDMDTAYRFKNDDSNRYGKYNNDIDYNSAIKQINLLASYQIQTDVYEYKDSDFYTDPSTIDKRKIAANDLGTFPDWYKEMFSDKIDVESNTLIHYGKYDSNKVSYRVDYQEEGVFYWNLVDGDFLDVYYSHRFSSEKLSEEREEEKIKLVNSIYYYVKEAKEKRISSNVISTNLNVELYQCLANGEMKLLNEGTTYSSTVSFKEYVMGVMIAEMGADNATNPLYQNAQKAFAVVIQNVALNTAHYKGDTELIKIKSGNCKQVFCSPYEGCHYLQTWDRSAEGLKSLSTSFTGPTSEKNDKNDSFSDGGYYWKLPVNEQKLNYLEEVVNSVLGTVMLHNNGSDEYIGVSFNSSVNSPGGNKTNVTKLIEDTNMTSYEDILKKWFSNYVLKNVFENNYTENVTFKDGGIELINDYNYEQNSYQEIFCRTDMTIEVAGCGPTSGAIAVSLLKNEKHDPVELMNLATNTNSCNTSGTDPNFFRKMADHYKLSYYEIKKVDAGYSNDQLNNLINDLSNGNTVIIAHMGQGTFTNSGHYITILRSKSNGEVLVWDPNAYNEDAYYDFDIIAAESYGFYVISR